MRFDNPIYVYRDYTDDGVTGVNGKQYLLDDNNQLMKFKSENKARKYLTSHDIDIDADEYMHFETEQEQEIS